MTSLEAELDRARELSVEAIADAAESIGFECTRCGACCRGHGEDEHTATVFPDEVREIRELDPAYDWRDVARPMPYGLEEGSDGPTGATLEWALATDGCGDCVFYEEDDGLGACTVHANRPLICRTYPFSVVLGDDAPGEPMGEVVDREGPVRAHECEGLGREIPWAEAEELARALKRRAIRELEEAIALREAYEPVDVDPGEVVVHDSEGPKRADGTVRRSRTE